MMKSDVLAGLVFLTMLSLWTADTVLDLGWFRPANGVRTVPLTTFGEVKPIFADRCLKCHSSDNWNWTNYDTAYRYRVQIKNRVWITRSMPLGGDMTENERQSIRDWVDGGAKP